MTYLCCKNLDTAIAHAKKSLIAEAKKDGLYEDFGQIEVRALREKFLNFGGATTHQEQMHNLHSLDRFRNWCESLSLIDLKRL